MEKHNYTVTVNGKLEHKIERESKWNGSIDGKSYACDVVATGPGKLHIIQDGRSYDVEVVSCDSTSKTLTIVVNSNKYQIQVSDKYDELLKSLGMDKSSGAKVSEMKAPMPGMVLDVLVTEGQAISKGDAIVVLEAMKMENILKAPGDTVVKKVLVKKGTAVEKNQVLISFN